MAIADDDIERLRSTVSIVDVVGQFVALRKVGRNWVGLCPFHAERTPSFNVREETGRYKCFGCDKSGDVFTFVQEHEHVDFVGAVEYLAAKAGMQLTYTSTGQTRERARRKQLVEAMGTAVEWYHQRLLDDPAARAARDYLRVAGAGRRRRPDVQARLGARRLGRPGPAVGHRRRAAAGDRAGVHQPAQPDAGRASGRGCCSRSSPTRGEAVAIGGRVLPGSDDPAKYKNSPETPIYAKSKTLYGLNWAKADIASADQVVVCEGYTDVIGFHRAGVRAGGGDVRHGVHRGPRAAAQALRQPGRAGLRRRRRRPGRRRAVLRVGAEVPGPGVRRPAARRAGSRRAGPARPGRARRGRRRRRAVPRLPPAAGDGRPAGPHAGGPGPPGRAGDGASSTSTPTPTCASCTPARSRGGRAAGRRPRALAEQRSAAARPSPSSRHAGRRSARTPSSSPSPCSPRTGTRSPGGWSRSCSTTRPTAGRSSPSPTPAATSPRPSSAADPEAREVLERAAVADLDVDAGGRGAQPDRRGRAAPARRAGRRSATPS